MASAVLMGLYANLCAHCPGEQESLLSSIWGWIDASVDKMLVLQVTGLGFDPQNPHKRLSLVVCAYKLRLEEAEADRSLRLTCQPA